MLNLRYQVLSETAKYLLVINLQPRGSIKYHTAEFPRCWVGSGMTRARRTRSTLPRVALIPILLDTTLPAPSLVGTS